MYDVIKYLTVHDNIKDDTVIFKDGRGKIYFLDKRYGNGVEEVKSGDRVLVWVLKEMDKVGYVRLEINGLDILSYIKEFSKLTVDDILTISLKTAVNKVRLCNDLYNHDIDFRIKIATSINTILLPFARDIVKFYDKTGINTELSEFRYESVFALSYLYEKFGIDDGVILDNGGIISEKYGCYPPNIIEISDDRQRVNFYHGIEEGLMRWDSIPLSELKSEILKRM